MSSDRLLASWLRTPRTARDLLCRLGNNYTERLAELPQAVYYARGSAPRGGLCLWYWTQGARDSRKQLRHLHGNEVDTANAREV